MLEVEQKFRVPDHAAVRAALARLKAIDAGRERQVDFYFNPPDRDFRATGEALRVRSGHSANVLTYKGPKEAGPVKTRTEIELPFEAGVNRLDDAGRLTGPIGFQLCHGDKATAASFKNLYVRPRKP